MAGENHWYHQNGDLYTLTQLAKLDVGDVVYRKGGARNKLDQAELNAIKAYLQANKAQAQHQAKFPQFGHIHCSSRFDRSAASLEADLDDWMSQVGLITLTEISNDNRANQMREKGWQYYNAKASQGQDECGTAWRMDTWRRVAATVRKLNNEQYYRLDGRVADPVVSSTVVLKRADTGHRLMVSVTHMPAHVEGRGGWRTTENKWQARKAAYLSSLANWATHVQALENQYKPDATLVVADWNLNLKEEWVRDLLRNRWGAAYRQAWTHFPTSGGSLVGGASAPPGAPGKGYGDRIIDGTLIRGVETIGGPVLMPRVSSSDHRPYRESFEFTTKAGHPGSAGAAGGDGDDEATGDTHRGDPWWGFGDYMDDEIYQVPVTVGAPGGEVL